MDELTNLRSEEEQEAQGPPAVASAGSGTGSESEYDGSETEDELTGESYYYHPETGETSWDTPAGASYAGGSGGAGGGRGFATMQRPPTHTRGTRKGCSCPSYIPLLLGPDSTCNC